MGLVFLRRVVVRYLTGEGVGNFEANVLVWNWMLIFDGVEILWTPVGAFSCILNILKAFLRMLTRPRKKE